MKKILLDVCNNVFSFVDDSKLPKSIKEKIMTPLLKLMTSLAV